VLDADRPLNDNILGAIHVGGLLQKLKPRPHGFKDLVL